MNYWKKRERGLHLLTALEIIRANLDTCDFQVRFCGETFHAHRAVLMASSDYFRGMMRSNMSEAKQGFADIRGLDKTAVKRCLEYLYTGEVFLSFETLQATLQSCDFLQMEEIREICFDFMQTSVSVQNCLPFLEYSTTYHSTSTIDKVVRFIVDNYTDFISTENYRCVEKAIAMELLRAALTYPTSVLWQGITNWIQYDLENRKGDVLDFLKEITEFDVKFALDEIVFHPLVKDNSGASKFIVTDVFFEKSSLFREHINLSNCFSAYHWTKKYKIDRRAQTFLRVVLEYMKNDFATIWQNMNFVQICGNDLYFLLNSAETRLICETIRWKAVLKWIEGKDSRAAYFRRFFQLIDLKKLSVDFIEQHVRSHPFVKSSSNIKEQITDAMFYHAKQKWEINSVLLFDTELGGLHCYHNNLWKFIVKKEDLVGGTLLGSKGEAYILNFPCLYKVRKDGSIEERPKCLEIEDNEVSAAIIHSGTLYVFHPTVFFGRQVNSMHSAFDMALSTWRIGSNYFSPPKGVSVCSTNRGIIFVGGGSDGRFTLLCTPGINSLQPSVSMIATPPYGRINSSCASYGDLVFLVGGNELSRPISNVRHLSTDIQIYSLRANDWSILKNNGDRYIFDKAWHCCASNEGIWVSGRRSAFGESSIQIQEISINKSSALSNVPQVNAAEMTGWIHAEPHISDTKPEPSSHSRGFTFGAIPSSFGGTAIASSPAFGSQVAEPPRTLQNFALQAAAAPLASSIFGSQVAAPPQSFLNVERQAATTRVPTLTFGASSNPFQTSSRNQPDLFRISSLKYKQ